METLQSTIFIEFDVNTKKITFLRGDNILDYDSNVTNIYVRVKYKNLSGNTVYLTPSELEDYKFSLYTIKPATNNINVITGEVTDELKENVYGGVVKFEIPRTCTNRLGIVKCEIHINQGNKIIGSSTFVLDVKQSLVTAFDDELLGDEDFPVLKQLILEIQKVNCINDYNRSKITTYSSDKVEDIRGKLSSQIEKVNNEKANTEYVDRLVSSVASGSPKGVYDTLETLQQAIPNGNNNIYITSDNGHWNYWDGSTWVSGGIYQSAGIDDEILTSVNGTYKYRISETIESIGTMIMGNGFVFTFKGDSVMYCYNDVSNMHIKNITIPDGTEFEVRSWKVLVWNLDANVLEVVPIETCNKKEYVKLISVSNSAISADSLLFPKIICRNNILQDYTLKFKGIPYIFNDGYNCSLKFGGIDIITQDKIRSYTWSQIKSIIEPIQDAQYGSYIKTSPESVKDTIWLNVSKALVYDIKRDTLDIIRLIDRIQDKNIIVIAMNTNGTLIGDIVEYYNSWRLRSYDRDILRDDYKTNIRLKENQVISQLKGDETFAFGLHTDIHVQETENGLRTVGNIVMDRLYNSLGLDAIVNCGDTIVYGKTDKNKGLDMLKHIMKKGNLREKNYIHAVGNHDYNGRGDLTDNKQRKSWTITPNEIYNSLGRHLKDVVWGSKQDMYFYKDFEDKKIRLIVLNTADTGQEWITDSVDGDYLRVDPLVVEGCRQKQLEWLVNTAFNFENKVNKNEWHTMICTHVGVYSNEEGLTSNQGNLENQQAVRDIINAFRHGEDKTITYTDTKYNCFNTNITTNFSTQGAMTFIAVFSGHNHLDRMVNSDKGLVNISTMCGYASTYPKTIDNIDMIPYEYSEFAIDVVVIDKVERKIKMNRFGANQDRVYPY